MSADNVPKAVLYWFPGSVWASVPRLVASEKKFTSNELEERIVDLGKGENFAPAYLRIHPEGHVPALVVPYEHTLDESIKTKFKALTSTIEVCNFLDQSTNTNPGFSAPSLSPATVQRAAVSKEIIEAIHVDAVDPNAALLVWRSEDERKAKLAGLPGGFLRGRQEALERYAKEVGDSDPKLKDFYARKMQENGGLLALLEGKGDSTEVQEKAKKLWTGIGETLQTLETKFEPNAVYLVGDQISLADLHVGAWLARLLAVAGATSITDVDGNLAKLEQNLDSGVKIGPRVTKWAQALFERDSFAKDVYADGLH
ncbi:glutathione S-transferase family protein [Rhodotorula paludigena]|uniref:glutathione S-transferase family protein n=1 Tax=Rhodotorula paludigena TaxID=86838 RepID=UPI0031731BC3